MTTEKSEIVLLEELRKLIEKDLLILPEAQKAPLFYNPIYYINELPGKRLRPLMSMLTAGMFGVQMHESLAPSVAIEMLHNFTLVHDDIMDNDDLRRGKPTVHRKWDLSTAILAGDGLLGLAYQRLLQSSRGDVLAMARDFTETMIEICEGQAQDKMFETMEDVSEQHYLEMIAKKTAVLISLSCKIGGYCAQLPLEQIEDLAEFGFNIGMGFQIQDDVLDIFADQEELGKKVGSDFEMNKKTILTIKLKNHFAIPGDLAIFKSAIKETGVLKQVTEQYQAYFNTADFYLNKFPENNFKEALVYLVNFIKNRDK